MNIPTFLASDDNYAPFVGTTICSIIKNTKSNVDFYILDGGISEENKNKIYSLTKKKKNISIEFITIEKEKLEKFPNIEHYSLNTFSRYFIPECKPKLNKIIYLDVDIIVKGDIAKLYNQDLEEFPLGAILEDFYLGNYTYLKKTIPEYHGGSNYFNAGVLVLNLDYFRKNNLTQILINKTLELANILNTADQDVFNLVFENNFKALDYKFNFMPDHFELLKTLHPQKSNAIKKKCLDSTLHRRKALA